MNQTVIFASKVTGLLLAYGVWAGLVWHGNTPADGFVAGLVSLSGFLTGSAVGKPQAEQVQQPVSTTTTPTQGEAK